MLIFFLDLSQAIHIIHSTGTILHLTHNKGRRLIGNLKIQEAEQCQVHSFSKGFSLSFYYFMIFSVVTKMFSHLDSSYWFVHLKYYEPRSRVICNWSWGFNTHTLNELSTSLYKESTFMWMHHKRDTEGVREN